MGIRRYGKEPFIHLVFSGADLRVPFGIRIVVLSQSPVNAASIRNLLMSEISILENLMNNTTVDRNKVSVRMDV